MKPPRGNLIFNALAGVLEAQAVPYRLRWGGKHPRLEFTVAGRRQVVPFPTSPSDHRSGRNAVASLRRRLARATVRV